MLLQPEDILRVVGIICEYNPFHSGHAEHIARTREALGDDTAVVCCMSGNFVQRGEYAVMPKHARAEAAARCGADLVIELPLPCALSSAERFARGAVRMLDALRVCEYLSFGSESGDADALAAAARALDTARADDITREELASGASYAAARCEAARRLGHTILNADAPNDILGAEYLRAIAREGSRLLPLAVLRERRRPSGERVPAAGDIRRMLLRGDADWESAMPRAAARLALREIAAGRAPIPALGDGATALSRLRALGREDYLSLPDAGDGLGERLARHALREPTLRGIADSVKTRRYAMSRIKRLMLCACLNIRAGDADAPPAYARVLAATPAGASLLREINARADIPVITKPAHAKKLEGAALAAFQRDAAATDFYVLSRPDQSQRRGGQEWTTSPVVLSD
jgi:predicted nucleotidyltransferase